LAGLLGWLVKLTRSPPVKTHSIETEVWLPRPLDAVFPFFADARNLGILTPPWLKFSVLTPGPIQLKTGARIDYRLRLHGIPIRWQSEISAWYPPHRFVDEQRRGPYRCWIHEHTFLEHNGGTLARDRVQYAVLGGSLVNQLFVARDLKRVFAFREETLLRIFGAASGEHDVAAR
jgi:ligand-binding SRPBCC domain-containing protein